MARTDSAARDREKWNRRFSESLAAPEPSPWLVRHSALLDRQPKGLAFDAASGLGRNSLYLAERGFEVEAWDLSDVATGHVAREARRRGLAVRARRRDLNDVRIPACTFEVVLDFFYLQRSLFPVLAEALVPGGLLFFETPLTSHTKPSGAPFPSEYTLEPKELLTAFRALEILDYREEMLAGAPGGGKAVAQLVARRPPVHVPQTP